VRALQVALYMFTLVLCILVAGCGKPATAPTAPATAVTAAGEPVDGDWIVSRLGVEPAHLNPLLDTSDAYTAQLTGVVFEPLLDRDNETLELEPLLAESYETSDDHLTYTFSLRKDATFSDGAPVTAHDVLFTFETIRDPQNETADLRNYYQDVERAELLDDYTIRFTCTKPYFRHLTMLGGLPTFPKHIYGAGDFNKHPNNRHPIGSGPYVFDSWETNQQVTFVRNENYWNKEKRPHIDRRVYKVIVDNNAAFQVLERQELDVMGLTAEQWVNRAGRPEFEAKFNKHTYWAPSGYIGSHSYIAWNMRKPQFKDKRVRRAMTMLLDRQLILEEIFYGLGKVVTGSAFSESPEYNRDIEPWPFEPEAAQRLLDDAGWTDSDNDGVRDKDGSAFKFEFLMPAGSREVEQMATVYKEELERAGIEMTIRQLEWATFIENLTQRKFDAVTLSWAIPVDQDPYQVWHSSQTEQGSNYPGFKNAEVDRLLEEARHEFDREARNALYRRWHEILHEEQPYTFLFNRQVLVAIDKRFANVHIYPTGLDQTEWWVPKAQQRYH